MANIQLLQGTEKIKDSYTKINTSVTNLNNAKLEKSGDTITGDLYLGVAQNYQRIIRRPSGDVSSFLSLDFEGVATAPVSITFFRRANTTGNKEFVIFRGDGTNAVHLRVLNGVIDRLAGQNVTITAGSGSPQGVVTAPPGSIYLNTAGGAGTTLWVKTTGTGNAGWTAVA